MTENNNIRENQYTEEQVMKVLMKMQPEYREMLFFNPFEIVMRLANDQEYVKNTIETYAKYADIYMYGIEVVKAFKELLNNQDNTDNPTGNVIDNLAKLYIGLSRDERLEFAKRMAEESNLDNSLDLLKYQWGKLLNTLGIK